MSEPVTESRSSPALASRTALGGYSRAIGSITLAEAPPTALVSLAFAADDRSGLAEVLRASCHVDWPPVGSSSTSESTSEKPAVRLMALQSDHYWLCWPAGIPAADRQAREWLGSARVHLTDQSDGWAHLTLNGPDCMAVLERLCPLDLHQSRFPIGSIGRTVMEHLSVIVVREASERFGLLTPRSSAASFRHAVENVALHVMNETAS